MEKACTMLFEFDIALHPNNPFRSDTPFGCPVIIAKGDVFAERDRLEEENQALRARLLDIGAAP